MLAVTKDFKNNVLKIAVKTLKNEANFLYHIAASMSRKNTIYGISKYYKHNILTHKYLRT